MSENIQDAFNATIALDEAMKVNILRSASVLFDTM